MANVQLVRQRNVQRNVYTTTMVDQAQSLELVQTMLHGALSTLTYLRGLFPTKAFESGFYRLQDAPLSYADFAAGHMPTKKDETDELSTKIPVLLRERSRRVDRFLDWLEKGAFKGLQSGDLCAVQIFIHPGSDGRDEVMETYTFSIQYVMADNGRRAPSGVTADTTVNQDATIETTNKALQQLLRSVCDLCEDLPELPTRRTLSMGLVYDGETKTSVDGFEPCGKTGMSFATAKGWQVSTRSLEFKSGHHDSFLKITGLLPEDSDSSFNQLTRLPKDLKYSHKFLRYSDILRMPPPGPPTTSRSRRQSSQDPRSLSTPDAKKQDRVYHVSGVARNTTRQASNITGTQNSFTNAMNGALDQMMQPEQISQGDTQTQSAHWKVASDEETTVTPTTGRTSRLGVNDFAELPRNSDTFPLRGSAREKISRHKLELRKTVQDFAKKKGGKTNDGQVMLCQCGFQKEEGAMVQCSVCSLWQHLHCYGYVGQEDPRIPEEHICYPCLLGKQDRDVFDALLKLATERRAMFAVSRNGLRTKTDLKDFLLIDAGRASSLHTSIKKSEFVTEAAKSHKPGYRETGKALFVPVQDDATLRKLLDKYYDPTTLLHQYYEPCTDASKIERAMQVNQRSLKELGTDLAEPATPHRSKLKSLATTPATSSPELPASPSIARGPEVPSTLVTPSFRNRRLTEKKRQLDQEAEARAAKKVATPATRTRHFTSLVTSLSIDAAGKSSPLSVMGSGRGRW